MGPITSFMHFLPFLVIEFSFCCFITIPYYEIFHLVHFSRNRIAWLTYLYSSLILFFKISKPPPPATVLIIFNTIAHFVDSINLF